MKHLFEYLNYREYLRDYYEEKKQEHSFYSYRLFSQKAGLKSPNFLKLVVDGERNLSKESVFRFSKALGLNKKEGDYFENLVFFNQSHTLEEKNAYLTKLMRYRKSSDPRKIEESEYKYYSAWYHPVVRELATAVDFHGDCRKLAQTVVPAITESEVQKSLELLVGLDFIRKQDDGTYVKTAASLSTGPHVRSVAVANYHKAVITLGAGAMERIPPAERDITSLTLSVSDEAYKVIVEKLQSFRRELLELAEDVEKPQKVVQLNFQLFPLTKPFNTKEAQQ
jgi:uncharacterized protein (TIGR02147 family)